MPSFLCILYYYLNSFPSLLNLLNLHFLLPLFLPFYLTLHPTVFLLLIHYLHLMCYTGLANTIQEFTSTQVHTGSNQVYNLEGKPQAKAGIIPWNFIDWTTSQENAKNMYNTSSVSSVTRWIRTRRMNTIATTKTTVLRVRTIC